MGFQKVKAETRPVITLFFAIKGVYFAQQYLFNVLHLVPPVDSDASKPRYANEWQTQLLAIKL